MAVVHPGEQLRNPEFPVFNRLADYIEQHIGRSLKDVQGVEMAGIRTGGI